MATVTTINICQLPDNILLDILSYLSVKDRCLSGRIEGFPLEVFQKTFCNGTSALVTDHMHRTLDRTLALEKGKVCKRWRKIVADNSLWRHLDLLPYKVDLRKMWKLIRAHLSSCLRTLRIRGLTISKNSRETKPSLSEPMLEELKERCTALSWLHMEPGNIIKLPSANLLPSSLTHLTLRKTTWQPRWLKDCADHFSNLVYLDLSGTVRVDNHDMHDVACFTKLTTLLLNDCYRLTERGLQEITTALTSLTTLSLRGCGTTDLVVHHMGRHLTALQDVDLSGSDHLTEGCLPSLVEGLKVMEQLALDDCGNLTVKAFMTLRTSSSLRNISMVLKNNPIASSDVDPWRKKMPKCVISV